MVNGDFHRTSLVVDFLVSRDRVDGKNFGRQRLGLIVRPRRCGTAGDLPYVSFGPGAGMDEARSLHAWLATLEIWTKEIVPEALWLADVYRTLVGANPVNEMVRDGMRKLCSEWARIYAESQPFILRGVEFPGVAAQDPTFDAAIEALAAGRKPFGLFSFGQCGLLLGSSKESPNASPRH